MAQTIQPLALNVRLSCQLLDVPESSYYERINRHPSKTQLRRQYLSLKISNSSMLTEESMVLLKFIIFYLNKGIKSG
ncbi:hypothetical protein ICE98_03735 [Lactococcus lactis]|nr:hypothetical protein [Lactococcus lactis]